MTATQRFRAGSLEVQVHATAEDAGRAMGLAVASRLRLLNDSGEINVVFASAHSQDIFLDMLVAAADVPWRRMNAFQLDEYIGLAEGHPSARAAYLAEHLTERVPLHAFHALFRPASDPADAAERYAELLQRHPLMLACISIGENGQLGFNDPTVADPNDPLPVKRASLDLTSRRQQVFDGTFPRVEDVPTQALTLTLPSIFAAGELHAVVPGVGKSAAVKATLEGPVDMRWPATVLRSHPRATLYLDEASVSMLDASRWQA